MSIEEIAEEWGIVHKPTDCPVCDSEAVNG